MAFTFSLLSLLFKTKKKDILMNYENNSLNWEDAKYTVNGLIEKQNLLTDLKFGRNIPKFNRIFNGNIEMKCSNNGCGIIALYNALKILGEPVCFPDLISEIEHKGAVLGGYFGVAPSQMNQALRRRGFTTKVYKRRNLNQDILDLNAKDYDSFILFSYNDANDITKLLHHMCIIKKDMHYKLINAGDETLYDSLSSAVYGYNKGLSKPILVIAIKGRKTTD